MVHLHSFTLTNQAHEVVELWRRGTRSGNVSWSIVMHDDMRERNRAHVTESTELEMENREMKKNIKALQDRLSAALAGDDYE